MAAQLCIVPARMASSRYPGKPLAPLLGLPLVLHVAERCRLSAAAGRVVVATCDSEIRAAVEAHGIEVVMTADTHPGCVDRTVEAVARLAPDLPGDRFILMVQGDEALVSPDYIDRIVAAHREGGDEVVNLATRISRVADHEDPNVVKVAVAPDGRALYFSRAPIPSRARTDAIPIYQQTGVMGFTRDFLNRFGDMARTPLEIAEGIDMLRVLEHGGTVRMVLSDNETVGVDTPQDLARAEGLLDSDPVTARYLVGAA